MREAYHEPVMLEEVLNLLPLAPGGCVVDGTVGLGGHAIEFAKRISPGGLLVALDWDEEMLQLAKERLSVVSGLEQRFYHADYRLLRECLAEATASVGRAPFADGILLDLGLNNAQISDPSRGISFMQSGPLDMRMDRSKGEPAAAWINRASAREIENVLFQLGDERWARRISEVIVARRKEKALQTTDDLVECVKAAIPAARRDKRIHPATRTFQAIRIYINEELDALEGAIRDSASALNSGGVLTVLSYHSGEDRAVKHAFQSLGEGYEVMFKKPMVPTDMEVSRNPKSRSAKLRAVRRMEETT